MDGARMMPFFWVRGEDEQTLRAYVGVVQASGCDAICVESRPHPDFMGPGWWRDLDILVGECKARGMGLWVFDDKHFPSGYANGAAEGSLYSRMMMQEKHMDVQGPVRQGAFMVLSDEEAFGEDEGLVCVVAARRQAGTRIGHDSFINIGGLAVEGLVDLTGTVRDGMAYFDVPEGTWRVYVVTCRHVKERVPPRSFVNPLHEEGARIMLKAVYEPHFERYQAEFGGTFRGFFSDEPALRAGRGYHAVLGAFPQIPLPWRQGLVEMLSADMGEDARPLLPGLWYDIGEKTGRVRYAYMNLVSRLYGENYAGILGDWCRAHGVAYIGHVIEQNNGHARLGSGAGHFFRSTAGQDMAGIDIVHHEIIPGFKADSHAWHSQDFEADDEFFYYMLAQMAVSSAHLDAKKRGRTMCELFGAYGWQLQVSEMRFLADFVLSRGVNYFVPHAFSLAEYPDPDSTPHFYAHGMNPLYPQIGRLFRYIRRVAAMIDGGRHVSRVAVLYHAEAEWACGYDCMKSQRVVRLLNQRQIECEIVPLDWLDRAEFDVLFVPWARALPLDLLEKCNALADEGKKVAFVDAMPERLSAGEGDLARLLARCRVVAQAEVAGYALAQGQPLVRTNAFCPDVKLYPYAKDGALHLVLFNENVREDVRYEAVIAEGRTPQLYDPAADCWHQAWAQPEDGGMRVRVTLEPAQLLVLAFGHPPQMAVPRVRGGEVIDGIAAHWRISLCAAGETAFTPYQEGIELPNITAPDRLPRFTGTVRYEAEVALPGAAVLDLGECAGSVQVWVDGMSAGERHSMPYTFALPEGGTSLRLEAVNTVVHAHRDGFSFFSCIPPTGVQGPVVLRKWQEDWEG